MDTARIAELLMGMDEAAWARHANPLSGWTRVATLPALALAIWSRAWTWINPRLFPPPKRLDSWMSRGVLGERLWLARCGRPIPAHHVRAARLLNAASAAGLVPLALGLWRFDFGLVLAGLAVAMGAKLWFLDRMVWLHDDAVEGGA